MRYLYLAAVIVALSFAASAAKSQPADEIVTKIDDVTPAESERVIRYLRVREATLIRHFTQMQIVRSILTYCEESNQVWLDTNADGVMDTKLQCFVVERIEPGE